MRIPPTLKPRDWSSQPPYVFPAYKSTALRGPKKHLMPIRQSLAELTGPVYGHDDIDPLDHDLTKNAAMNGEPLGERIVVSGRVLDEGARPVRGQLVEVWQANAAGRYVHKVDKHPAPLDANFLGAGRCLTDANGRYRFYSIKPGAYPWGNSYNAWRPAHIHFSLFGRSFATRLVTQMYFPGDPLLATDPIYNSAPAGARERMISAFSAAVTEHQFALGYVFDIVLRGPKQTPRGK